MVYVQPDPKPAGNARRKEMERIRKAALSLSQPSRIQRHNGESEAFAPQFVTNFTKGLPHNAYGIAQPGAFEKFMASVAGADTAFDVPLGPERAEGRSLHVFLTKPKGVSVDWSVRGWESPLAGHAYDLEGPDADAVAMAPAPRLGSGELTAEMAEVYAMALLRDTPFEAMRVESEGTRPMLQALNGLSWFNPSDEPIDEQGNAIDDFSAKRRERVTRGGKLTGQNLFRGSTPGCVQGPYISQFLLQGTRSVGSFSVRDAQLSRYAGQGFDEGLLQKRYNPAPSGDTKIAYGPQPGTAEAGYILYGAQRIDQRVHSQKEGVDYLTHWSAWLDAQNGASMAGIQAFETDPDKALRFISTPRDLASYVHYDQLYQAYLNACLFLLTAGVSFDHGLPEPNRSGTRTAFATFGGPHILSLVTEVATRALKAVRRQKFAIHCRARPEAIGGLVTLFANGHGNKLGASEAYVETLCSGLAKADYGEGSLMADIAIHNDEMEEQVEPSSHAGCVELPKLKGDNYLLPMAFPEGSPMHPSYGAGHATVAGACVTILKAFFQMYDQEGGLLSLKDSAAAEKVLVPDVTGLRLVKDATTSADDLKLAGELDKLAANISIGRNMAGVHTYSDYYDSLRMGERVALGLLMEQMPTYCEPFSLSLPSFDSDHMVLSIDGGGDAEAVVSLSITDREGATVTQEDWFARHAPKTAGASV